MVDFLKPTVEAPGELVVLLKAPFNAQVVVRMPDGTLLDPGMSVADVPAAARGMFAAASYANRGYATRFANTSWESLAKNLVRLFKELPVKTVYASARFWQSREDLHKFLDISGFNPAPLPAAPAEAPRRYGIRVFGDPIVHTADLMIIDDSKWRLALRLVRRGFIPATDFKRGGLLSVSVCTRDPLELANALEILCVARPDVMAIDYVSRTGDIYFKSAFRGLLEERYPGAEIREVS